MSRRKPPGSTTRRWSAVIHRWLGFTAGSVLVIAGVTGSLLAFYVEIERSAFPHLQSAHPHARPASFEAVYQRLASLPPDQGRGGRWSIEVPPDGGVITSRRHDTTAPGEVERPTRMVTLDPLTLDVLRDARWNDTFFTWIYDLHMYLQLGSRTTIGQAGMGIAAFLMLVMLASGLGNWWLPPGTLRNKLRLKLANTTPARRTYDLHRLLGLATVSLLALPIATGVLLSFPNQVRTVLGRFSALKPTQPDVHSRPTAGGTRLTVDQALAKGLEYFPQAQVIWVHVPTLATEPYDLEMRQPSEPVTRFPHTHVFLDQYDGRVLAAQDPRRDTVGDMILNWIVPIHDGKAFGTIGRAWVMLIGLVPALLSVTGLMRWWQKRPKDAIARRGAAAPAATHVPLESRRPRAS